MNKKYVFVRAHILLVDEKPLLIYFGCDILISTKEKKQFSFGIEIFKIAGEVEFWFRNLKFNFLVFLVNNENVTVFVEFCDKKFED